MNPSLSVFCPCMYLCDSHALRIGAILDAQRRVHGVAGANQNVLDAGLDQHLNLQQRVVARAAVVRLARWVQEWR